MAPPQHCQHDGYLIPAPLARPRGGPLLWFQPRGRLLSNQHTLCRGWRPGARAPEMEQEAWGTWFTQGGVLIHLSVPASTTGSLTISAGPRVPGGRGLFSILKHWKELLREEGPAWLCKNETFLHIQNKSHVLWL